MSATSRRPVAVLSVLMLAIACGPDRGISDPGAAGNASLTAVASDQFSEWCAPVNLGPTINSDAVDNGPFLSRDGLALFLGSQRAGGAGIVDLWVATRASVDAPWQKPVNVAPLNSARIDVGPSLSADGHVMYFASDRPSPFPETGSLDIWTSWREDVHDPLGWEPPINIGAPVNTAQAEVGPARWGPELYFSRGLGPNTPPLPPGVPATPLDLYVSRVAGAGYGDPEPLAVLNSPAFDQRATVRFDGREIFFGSSREGGRGQEDIYVSTRAGSGLEWSPPVGVDAINTAARESQPFLSADGTMLFFSSDRPGGSGNFDLWVATRRIGAAGTACQE